MAEMEKDYKKVQIEKFEEIKSKCPWKYSLKYIERYECDNNHCLAIYEECNYENCAIWYFLGR